VRSRYGAGALAIELSLVAVVVIFLFPVYALVRLSGGHYTEAWSHGELGAALVHSTVVVATSLVCLVAVASCAAYFLARTRRRLGYRLYILFLTGLALPMQLGLVPLYRTMAAAGLLGSYAGIALVYTGLQLPLAVFLYAGFLRGLPREFEEAALVDGASHLQTFTRVTFPLLRPVTGVVLAINAIILWNDFLLPLLYLGGSGRETASVFVYGFVGEYGTDWGPIFATIVLVSAPMLAIFLAVGGPALKRVGGRRRDGS
jgi:raffinose/stachyose/melibiose transport system permease protein